MENEKTTLQTLLNELTKPDTPLRAALIYRLSDAIPEDLAVIATHWNAVPVERRRLLFTRLAETSETNFDVDFTNIAQFGLDDDDPEVRANAISTLWFNEDPLIMGRFMKLLTNDESSLVRAAAAEALGRFVLAGELGDIPEAIGHEAEEALLEVLEAEDEPSEVYLRALESVAYSGRDEVAEHIMRAHHQDDIEVRASAIFSMGRSADERWSRYVVQALDAPEPELRFEAARACGELGISAVVGKLIRMANETDREIRENAIWALGEIGGSEAQNALLRLADRETDETLLEVIEDAINNAQLASGQFGAVLLDGDGDQDIEDFDDLDLLDEFGDEDD